MRSGLWGQVENMFSFIAQLARDEDGGPLVEVSILLPILILFLFGGVDFMNALYQWNAAAKAVEIGARIAAVSDPIASGLTSIADNALSSGLASGSPMPDFTVECDGGAAACSCASGACAGPSSITSRRPYAAKPYALSIGAPNTYWSDSTPAP